MAYKDRVYGIREEFAMFSQSVVELIKKRSSWRTYDGKPLVDEDRERLQQYFAANSDGPFGTNMRFKLIDRMDEDGSEEEKLGTYGFIKGSRTFVAGVNKEAEKDMENYGYVFEKMVLFATELGLGTCWLGGTFTRSSFGKKAGIKEGEIIPAVTPVGYGEAKRSIRDHVVRLAAGSKNRKPWGNLFFDGNFDTPLTEKEAGTFATPLEMVRLGPSASNKQPWIIVRDKNHGMLHFYVNRTRGYAKMLSFDIQKMDVGIAMCHFELTANELNLSGQWIDNNPGIPLPQSQMEYVISWAAKE